MMPYSVSAPTSRDAKPTRRTFCDDDEPDGYSLKAIVFNNTPFIPTTVFSSGVEPKFKAARQNRLMEIFKQSGILDKNVQIPCYPGIKEQKKYHRHGEELFSPSEIASIRLKFETEREYSLSEIGERFLLSLNVNNCGERPQLVIADKPLILNAVSQEDWRKVAPNVEVIYSAGAFNTDFRNQPQENRIQSLQDVVDELKYCKRVVISSLFKVIQQSKQHNPEVISAINTKSYYSLLSKSNRPFDVVLKRFSSEIWNPSICHWFLNKIINTNPGDIVKSGDATKIKSVKENQETIRRLLPEKLEDLILVSEDINVKKMAVACENIQILDGHGFLRNAPSAAVGILKSPCQRTMADDLSGFVIAFPDSLEYSKSGKLVVEKIGDREYLTVDTTQPGNAVEVIGLKNSVGKATIELADDLYVRALHNEKNTVL